MFRLAVAGAHMQGLPLNSQLLDLAAVFVATVQTAACYRMYDLGGVKPALIRQPAGQQGFAFQVELWDMPVENVGVFLECALLTVAWASAASTWHPYAPSCACAGVRHACCARHQRRSVAAAVSGTAAPGRRTGPPALPCGSITPAIITSVLPQAAAV